MRRVDEVPVAVVVEEHFIVVAEVGDEEIDETVVLVVARGNANGGEFEDIIVQREDRRVALVLEGAIAFLG